MPTLTPRRTVLLLLGVAVVAVFFPVCGYEFQLYDDDINVYANPLVTNVSWDQLARIWREPYLNLYIPLTYTLWALLGKGSTLLANGAGTPDPALFHGANLALHLANTLLTFRIVELLCKETRAALAAALLFALHPVQVEPVAWVTGFKDGVSGFFLLLALFHYIVHTQAEVAKRWGWPHYPAASLCFLAALLAKPGAVVLPLMAGVIGWLTLQRSPRQLAWELGPWLLCTTPFIWATTLSQPGTELDFIPTLWQRFLVAGDAITFYLGKLLLPIALGPDYGRTPASVLGRGLMSYGAGLLPYLGAGLLLWRCREPLLMAAAGIFVLALLPVSGLLPFNFQTISTVADRYLYVALLGPALGLAWLLTRFEGRGLRAVVAMVLLLFAVKAMVQVRLWRDPLTTATHAVAVNPHSRTWQLRLGIAHSQRQEYEQAIAAYRQALAIDPSYADAYFNLGVEHALINQLEPAISYYQKAISLDPQSLPAYRNVAELYERLNRKTEAIDYYRRVAEFAPLAETFVKLAALSRGLGRKEEAIDYYRQATNADPGFVKAYYELGLLLAELNRRQEAIEAYRQVLALQPDSSEAYNNLGIIYQELRQSDEAIAAYRRAMALRPDLPGVYHNLGFVYFSLQRYQEAIPLFIKAIDLKADYLQPYTSLGLSYARLGRYAEGVSWLRKAIAMDPSFAPAVNALAQLFLEQGQYPLAVEYADQAARLGLADPGLAERLKPHRKK